MRINVVKENGGRVDIGSALIRNFLRTVDARSIYLVGPRSSGVPPISSALGIWLSRQWP
jgi:uncharacterized RDD family membrane protein YckC